MGPHFSTEEMEGRLARTRAAIKARGLDALLCFAPETQYWLTGYDTFGYCFFQCLVVGVDGTLALLTRAPDMRQAQNTSLITDINVWPDEDGRNPAVDLRALLAHRGFEGKVLGAEFDTHGLTHHSGKLLETIMDGFATLSDASDIVPPLRLRKSPAETEYIRKAADLTDAALDAALDVAGPGAFEGDILAAMQSTIFRAGGDDPANEFIIGSGPNALLCRYYSGRRNLDANDQLTLEWSGAWHHYHAAAMRTVIIGEATDRHRALFDASAEALLACEEKLRPGNTMGDVFATHAAIYDKHGLKEHRMNACGYAMGARYAPSWMDWPMFYRDNPVVLEAGMAFFLHMICFDSHTNTAMALGRTSLVTESDAEILNRHPLEIMTK